MTTLHTSCYFVARRETLGTDKAVTTVEGDLLHTPHLVELERIYQVCTGLIAAVVLRLSSHSR